MGEPAVEISLNFMPAFYHKHLGLTYGEAYYLDPQYRAEVEQSEARFLYEVLGRWGVGQAEPQPNPCLSMQPIDVVKITQGATLHCPEAATLESRGHPWAGLSVSEIAALDPQAAAAHPFLTVLIAQYHDMQRLYGERADIFGVKAGFMGVHTPYTTAHQLCGEGLFYLLSDDPAGARVVLDQVWEIYRAIYARLATELHAPPPTRVFLGDCSAAMLSARLYREVVLPSNQALAAGFAGVSYHSCGPSSHLLSAFAEIPAVGAIELGPGTDLEQAVALLPGVAMRPLVDPLLLRNAMEPEVAAEVAGILAATAPAPATTLCAWSCDAETPLGNVETLCQSVQEFREHG